MGELIRNIKEITLGNDRYMVEQNEGYTVSQGNIVHIQNDKFRFVLTEKEFFELFAMIIRSRTEMDRFKESEGNRYKNKQGHEHLLASKKDEEYIIEIVKLLEGKNIDYRIVDKGKSYVSIIFSVDSEEKVKESMKSNGFEKLSHIMGEDYGYSFLYQMKPFQLYKYQDMFVEIIYQLPVLSFTPNTWIPLDKMIQKRVFAYSNEIEGVKYLDRLTYLIYRLTWSVYKNKSFSDYDRLLLSEGYDTLASTEGVMILEKIFFKFTNKILDMIKRGDYNTIVSSYFLDRDY